MGVTIHFSGTIKEPNDPRLEAIVMKWAPRWRCEVIQVKDQRDGMFQVRNNEVVKYNGLLNGFILNPHPDSEPVAILYGEDGFMCRSCKTQFAGTDVHVEVVEFLRDLSPLFNGWEVKDEGGYWETSDRKELDRRMDFLSDRIDALAQNLPEGSLEGPDRTLTSGMN